MGSSLVLSAKEMKNVKSAGTATRWVVSNSLFLVQVALARESALAAWLLLAAELLPDEHLPPGEGLLLLLENSPPLVEQCAVNCRSSVNIPLELARF